MGYFKKHELFEMTLELTEEIVSEAGDKSTAILSNPKNMTNFIQVVFDKLCEINETLEEEEEEEEEEEPKAKAKAEAEEDSEGEEPEAEEKSDDSQEDNE